MIKICICDDSEEHIERIDNLVRQYVEEKLIDAQVLTFTHPDKLITVCQTQQFNIYILDIVMPMINGLKLGEEIRRHDSEAIIIFTTTAPEYALDSFLVNPLDYILKPVEKPRFFETMDKAVEKVKQAENSMVTVKTQDGIRIIPFHLIVYCERVGNKIHYYLSSGECVESLTIRVTFADMTLPLAKDPRFLQPHASYLINMRYVEKLNKGGFTLKGGYFVPVSSKQYTFARNTFFDYRLGEGL